MPLQTAEVVEAQHSLKVAFARQERAQKYELDETPEVLTYATLDEVHARENVCSASRYWLDK